MRDGSLSLLGGTGKTVEIDETFYGKQRARLKGSNKERGGSARTFHITGITMAVFASSRPRKRQPRERDHHGRMACV